MADTKLSALTATGGVLDADLIYTVTGGASKKATIAQLRVQTDTSSAGVVKAISTLAAAQTASTTAGVGLTITADNAVAGSTNAGAAAGGTITLTAGNAAQKTSGNADGGNVFVVPGSGIGTGTTGQLRISGTSQRSFIGMSSDGAWSTNGSTIGISTRNNSGTAELGICTGINGGNPGNLCAGSVLLSGSPFGTPTNYINTVAYRTVSGNTIGWSSSSTDAFNNSNDTALSRAAALVVVVGNGTAADRTGWIVDTGVRRVSSQFDKTSSAALADIPGLSVALISGRTYTFEACLFTVSGTSGGVQAAIAFSSTVTSIRYEGSTTNANAVAGQTRATASGTAVGGVTAVTAGTIWISGTITAGANGNLTVQFAQNASNGTTSSVLTGSYLIVRDNP